MFEYVGAVDPGTGTFRESPVPPTTPPTTWLTGSSTTPLQSLAPLLAPTETGVEPVPTPASTNLPPRTSSPTLSEQRRTGGEDEE